MANTPANDATVRFCELHPQTFPVLDGPDGRPATAVTLQVGVYPRDTTGRTVIPNSAAVTQPARNRTPEFLVAREHQLFKAGDEQGRKWATENYSGQDPASGIYVFDHRDFRASIARWMEEDPKGYPEGADLFQGFRSTPERFHDPLGTDCRDCRCPGGGYFHPRTRVTDGPSGEKVAEKLRDLALKAFGEITGLASTLYATAAQGLTDLDHNVYYYAVITTCKESDGHRAAGTEPLVFSFQCPGVGPAHVQPGDGFTDQDPDAYERSMSICDKLAAAAFNRWIDGLAEFKSGGKGSAKVGCPNLADYHLTNDFKPVKPWSA